MKKETVYWSGAVLTYGVLDVATTLYGVSDDKIIESNPFILNIMGEPNLIGSVLLKTAVISLLFLYYRLLPEKYETVVPVTLLLAGVSIVTWNILLILRV